MKVLVLEDNSNRIRQFKQRILEHGWVGEYVDTAREAIRLLKEKEYDLILLDHDLGDHDLGDQVFVNSAETNTGAEVARYINKNPVDAKVIIHSLNPAGSRYMQEMIPGSFLVPFVWDEKTFHKTIKG